VENKFHTISRGQSTHQDLAKTSGLRCILFDKSCLRRIFFHKNLACGRIILIKILFLIILGCFLKFLILSINLLVVKMIQDVTVLSKQVGYSRISLKGMYVWGVNINSAQALRLLCLKGHVRACDATL